MGKITLVLDGDDVLQILDGLRERMADWQYTARYLEDGLVDDERMTLECSDAAEAQTIADHYMQVITSIEKQIFGL